MQIITAHTNTDFDALASMVAATLLYPDAVPIIPGNLNPNVKGFLSIHKELFPMITVNEVDLNRVESLVVVDVNRWERLDRMKELKHREDVEVILWDHHMNSGNIRPDWSCQEEMGATVTLMIRHLKSTQIDLTPMQATLLLAGVYEDTGNLTFSGTTAEDVYAAGFLLERGADLSVLNRFLKPLYGEKQKDVLFRMLQTAKRRHVNGYRVCINTQVIEGHVGSLAVVVQMFREILNVEAAFGIFTDKNSKRCVVIGRGDSDGLHIGEILKALGGGGHQGAGSAMIKSGDPEAVEQRIMDAIMGDQQASVRISDLMSFPVVSVSPRTTMRETAMILRERGISGFPVVDEGKLIGMISRRDFRKIRGSKHLDSPVKAFMSTRVLTITLDKSPTEAARLMVKHDVGRLPVVEEEEILGILTRTDAMRYFYDLLPQ